MLLDMRLSDFRAMVKSGYLPPGRQIAPGFVRWPVSDIHAIINGINSDSVSGIQW